MDPPMRICQSRGVRVAVINQKGGTGKTTTSIHLASFFAKKGRKTLLIDNDPQGSIATSLRLRPGASTEVFLKNKPHSSVVQKLSNRLLVLTSDQSLFEVETQLHLKDLPIKELFENTFGDIDNDFDLIVDMAPSRSLLNEAALYFVDQILIPVSCDYLALVGVRDLLQFIRQVNQRREKPVVLTGLLPTLYDARSKVSRESVELLNKHFPGQVYAPIRQSTKVREAPSFGKDLYSYAPRSPAAQDYQAFAKSFLEHCAAR